MGRRLAIALCLLVSAGCSATGRRAEIEEGTGIPPGPVKPPFGPFERASILLGSDPGPAEPLAILKAIHDPVDGSHRLQDLGTAERCREAVADLRGRDYTSWQVAAHVVSRVSRLAVRDPAALVRREALDTLLWFGGWLRPSAAAAGRGRKVEEGDVIRALRDLKTLRKTPEADRTDADRALMVSTAEVLGSSRWVAGAAGGEGLALARLSGAQRALSAVVDGRLASWRRDPPVRRALDRAALRVADQVVYLTFLAALDDPVAFVRTHAVRILRPLGGRELLPAYARTLARETDPTVVLALLEEIGRAEISLPGTRRLLVPPLCDRLLDADESLRSAAARALDRVVGGRARAEDPAAWRRWWREHRREYGRP